jgi:hypothetical protein
MPDEKELPEKDKRTHASVNYEATSTHSGEFCGRCRHVILADPPRCNGVQSPIALRGWCHRFRSKPTQ